MCRRKFAAAYPIWKRFIRRYKPGEKIDRMLDVACGLGNFALCLANGFKDSRITALDLEDDLIHFASGAARSAGLERLSEGTTLFDGMPVVGKWPFSLPLVALQALAGWFPRKLGESYMVVARLDG